ncbi:kinesin-like protein subito isoform X2 [Coccinella septempunctata]|uniref:kinesin-like protein subito isoform X2 n=1 Tax=Coccinella septempunctata TaxID=41139 RepID=UPI001D069A9D|nr:kinesin-like protein subito isoform X2 [Coccinella septempunctata]
MNLNFPEDVSYIRSRDPSIQNFNWKNLNNVRVNLQFSVNEKTDRKKSIVEGDNSCIVKDEIPIYLRIKPSTNAEDYVIHENQLLYRTSAKNKEAIYKRIEFSKIFNVNSRQVHIFDEIVKIRVLEFLNGKDTTLFTFGTPGAGKTYTTIGTPEEPGFFPRTLEYIFKTLPELPDVASVKPSPEGKVIRLNPDQKRFEQTLKASILRSQRATDRSRNIKSYQAMQDKLRCEPFASLEQLSEVSLGVWVSFVEISNEEIYDLLQRNIPTNGDKKKLRLGISNGKPYIKDLTYLCVSSGLEAYQVYQYGAQKLKCPKTSMRYSNRSHSIFTIKIAHTLANRDTSFISCLNICNLAGADGTRRANDRDRSKECNSINNSLLVLGKCINNLVNSLKNPNIKHIIPYRDSKLTQLFQRALSGLEDFCIIVNINSSKEAAEDTHSVLNFSALTKDIISKEMVMKYVSSNKSRDFFEFDEEIKMLEEALDERKFSYEDLKRNRPTNYKLEKEALIKGWEEIFNDSKALFHRKKKFLQEECEELYRLELQKIEQDMKRKIEKNKMKLLKRKTDEVIEYLKKKFEDNEIDLKISKDNINQLEKKLQEIKELSLGIESRNKLIVEYERILEKMEMDSFLFNEICCEGKDSIVGSDSEVHIVENTDESIDELVRKGEVLNSVNCSSNLDDNFSISENECEQQNSMIVDHNSSLLNEGSSLELITTPEQTQNCRLSISKDECRQQNSVIEDCNSSLSSLELNNTREQTQNNRLSISKNEDRLQNSMIEDYNSSLLNEESSLELVTTLEQTQNDKLSISKNESRQQNSMIEDCNSSLSSLELNNTREQTQNNRLSISKNQCKQQNSMVVDYNTSLINEESSPELVTTLEQTQMDISSLNKVDSEEDETEAENMNETYDEGIDGSISSVNIAENNERNSESLSSDDLIGSTGDSFRLTVGGALLS